MLHWWAKQKDINQHRDETRSVDTKKERHLRATLNVYTTE